MKQIQIPKTGKFFVTVLPYSDAKICYPQTVHRTKRALKMAKTKLSGGNILLCVVNGRIYGYMAGVLDTYLYGDFGFEEMIEGVVDYEERWNENQK